MSALDELTSFVDLVHDTFDEHNLQRQLMMEVLNKQVSPDNALINNVAAALNDLVMEEEAASDEELPPNPA